MNARLALGLASAVVCATIPARAQEPVLATEATSLSARADRLEAMWRLELGYRGNFVTDAGFNPFSTEDYLSQVSVAASRTVLLRRHVSFAVGLAWDYGKSTASARGDATSLEVHRLTVPLEGRLHFGALGYVFARAAPGLAMERAEVNDPSAPCPQVPSTGSCAVPLTQSRWLFATDVSAGYAYPLWSRTETLELVPRIWLQAEGGYGWILTQRVRLSPDLPSGDARLASGIDLASLTMRGAFFRVAAAISF
ncbi:MAG: hypothetical protein M3O36_15400 [Myxococcota bacterium]|nr:hypothetical protein [Myxococcota bacterium]